MRTPDAQVLENSKRRHEHQADPNRHILASFFFFFFYGATNIFVLFEKLIFPIQAKAAHTSDFVGYTTVSRAVGLSNINVALG